LLTVGTAADMCLGAMLMVSGGDMNTSAPNYPGNQVPPPAPWYYHSDSSFITGLGVVLLVFGGAITHNHTVPLIGLGLMVLAHWFD
jgi:hypothetical protein